MTNANGLYNTHPQYNGAFEQPQNPNPLDTSAAFQNISNLAPNNLDYGQYPAPSFQQRINDGNNRHQSPGFQYPAYQVNQVIPAKRGRPGDDNISASPQPAPGMLGASRAHTPQQPQTQQYPNNFSGMQGGQGFQTPNTYQHLQNGASQPSPSPALAGPQAMQGQRPPSASPHPFSAGGNPNFGNYSLPPNNQNSMTAQQNQMNQQYMRNMQMGQSFGQRNMGTPQMPQAGMPGAMTGLQSAQNNSNGQYQPVSQDYKVRLQQAQNSAINQARNQTSMMGPGSPAPARNGLPVGRPTMAPNQQDQQSQQSQQPQNPSGQPFDANSMLNPAQAKMQAQNGKSQEQSFFERLNGYSQQHGIKMTPNPQICGRPVNLYHLFAALTRSNILLQGPSYNKWELVCQIMNFPEQQYPTAATELKTLYQSDLSGFVRSWYMLVQKRKMQMQQDQTRPMHSSPQQSAQTIPPPMQGPNMTAAQTYQMQLQQQQQAQQQVQAHPPQQPQSQPQPPPSLNQAQQTPQPPFTPQYHDSHRKPTPQATTQSPALNQQSIQFKSSPTPAAHEQKPNRSTPGLDSFQVPRKPSGQGTPTPMILSELPESIVRGRSTSINAGVVAAPLEPPQPSKNYAPRMRTLEYHGGIPLAQINLLGEELSKVKPGVPSFDEMGALDMHAITLALQSGIHGEMSYALDQLVSLSNDQRCNQLSLVDCGDLVETLLEMAEDQLEILVEGSSGAANTTRIPTFEELTRATRAENDGIQDEPDFATPGYERRQAVDRILAVTTILRNISFGDSALNHDMLASGPLIPFIATTMKLIGSHVSLFPTTSGALDFYKDCVILMSNICHRVELQSKEDALGILQLLVSFAPSPAYLDSNDTHVTFASYDPKLHHYLPSAIDALAKLLARDEPNRTYAKAIFSSEYSSYLTTPNTQSSLSNLLITQAFALAIATIPDRSKTAIPGPALFHIIKARNPFLSQGMLAADILAAICPGANDIPATSEDTAQPPLAQLWLESEDGWAKSLLNLVVQFANEAHAVNLSQRRDPATGRIILGEDRSGFGIIVQRGSSALARLAEKCDGGRGGMLKVGDDGVVSGERGGEKVVNGGVYDTGAKDGHEPTPVDASGAGIETNTTTTINMTSAKDPDTDLPSDGAAVQSTSDDTTVNPTVSKSRLDGTSKQSSTSSSLGVPFRDLLPTAEEVLAALSSPMFDPVALRSLLTLERLVA